MLTAPTKGSEQAGFCLKIHHRSVLNPIELAIWQRVQDLKSFVL